MAKFVLAGKTDCPHFAKAELLADKLQKCLPNFRIHKIAILPDQWKGWLEDICKRNGWKHERSPLVWRELVYQGGGGMLLGGFSDFMEHCQDYYNITSDMPSELMLSVAAENHETRMDLIVEEQHRAGLIKPLHIWICSALHPTCCFLIPHLLSAEVFPHNSAISLHLLHLEREEELEELKMVTEDLDLPLLHQVTIHTDLTEAFKEADVIVMLEESCSEEEKKKEFITKTYKEYGQLIDTRADKDVKVIVSGDSFVNLRCSLLLENARSINGSQFVAMAAHLGNEARATIAKKLEVTTADVTDVIVWGNISGSFYIDLQRAQVFNYKGAIRGPASFSKPALKILHSRKWIETDLQDSVRRQRAAVVSKTCRTAAMTDASGILSVLRAWNGDCGAEIFSLGVVCKDDYNLPDGVVLSVPVTFKDGKWSVLFDVTVGDELKEKLQRFTRELQQEKELAEDEESHS
ncbi:putative malate dehydrogenase 1B [Cheilinus undulatus]|uniref:putative malate dehydrogenase 1B n=1 Tax=Cheilinus undulatus TaxID=241271 RepID=UPI001BD5EDB0|nr:putative malate dehydrogenase 1B [Cheilinus undulatus]